MVLTWGAGGGALSRKHMVVAGAWVEQVHSVAHHQARPLQCGAVYLSNNRLPHAHIVHLHTALSIFSPYAIAPRGARNQ